MLIDAVSEPLSSQLARNLRASQADARHRRARYRAAVHLIGQREHALVQFGALECLRCATLQIAMDGCNAHFQALRKGPCRQLGTAGLALSIRPIPNEVAI